MPAEEVVVVGAGVTGYTTGLLLARAGYRVQVWAEKRGQTPSNWIWEYPPYNITGQPTAGTADFGASIPDAEIQRVEALANDWARRSYFEFLRLASEEPSSSVQTLPVINLSRHNAMRPNLGRDFLLDYKSGEPALEVARDVVWKENPCPFVYADAESYTAPGCHGPEYLTWLRKELEALGGVVTHKRTVSSLTDALNGLSARVLVNCTGLGARELAADRNVFACKGQLLHVEAPWVTAAVFSDDPDAYAIAMPGHDLELGGTAEDGVESRKPDPKEMERILSSNTEVIPSLKDAVEGDVWVGLRPKRRGGPRVELEVMGDTFVVHNYGHGGSGMCCSFGCAEDVVKLVDQAIAHDKHKSNL